MITSVHNSKIQWVRALQSRSKARQDEQVFVVEGVRLCEEALRAGWKARILFHTEDLNARGQAVVDSYHSQAVPIEIVSPHVLHAISDTETPQGILAVIERRALPLPEVLDFVFIPDGVRDPGNLGTMLRTAGAAGVQAVFLPPGTVDPFSPKVVRAGMGIQFSLPVLTLPWKEIRSQLSKAAFHVYLAAAGEGQPYLLADFRGPLALIVGGEAQGAGEQGRQIADRCIFIPMPGGGESLNVAAAAAILLYEVVRQRTD
ncbi:MAG TPA: RNA methyltransferase [Anaerolineales bacterium]|nr:RNA methyltransferase [Anaerolineales bacterium]